MTDIKAGPLKEWLEARDASLHIRSIKGEVHATIAARTPPRPPVMTEISSNDLDEAVRLAMLQFDIGRA